MIRRPRTPTLFPYPPLFRFSRMNPYVVGAACGVSLTAAVFLAVMTVSSTEPAPAKPPADKFCVAAPSFRLTPAPPLETPLQRSEEHTSELQSHLNLVCRLLL